jgi:hypothetical protein
MEDFMSPKKLKATALPKLEGEWITYNKDESRWNREGFTFLCKDTLKAYCLHLRFNEYGELQILPKEDSDLTDFYRRKKAIGAEHDNS